MEEGANAAQAIATACRVRLRPILMTSLATIIGLLPMALKMGEGSESYAPLARVLIGGLTVSVLLTIFLVPAGFYLAYRERELSYEGWRSSGVHATLITPGRVALPRVPWRIGIITGTGVKP